MYRPGDGSLDDEGVADGETLFCAVLGGINGLGGENGEMTLKESPSIAMTSGVVDPAATLLAGSTTWSSSMAGTGME